MASLLFTAYELSEFKKSALEDLQAMAKLIGNRSNAAMSFDDPELAHENLTILEQLATFKSACIYGRNNRIFTSFNLSQINTPPCPKKYKKSNSHFDKTNLYIHQPIFLENDILGHVFIHANFRSELFSKLKSIGLVIFILFLAFFISFLSTIPLLRIVTQPIQRLLTTVNSITIDQDYSKRAQKHHDDELGQLVDAFNHMIETVGQKNDEMSLVKNHYQALYDDNPSIIFNLSENGEIISINQYGREALKLSKQPIENKSIYEFIYPDDKSSAFKLFDLALAASHTIHKHELRLLKKDQSILWVRESVRVLADENGMNTMLMVCEDITTNKLLSEQIAYQASHDALTNLVNRSEFDTQLKIAVKNAYKSNIEYALCYLDLDQFKVVNDTCGHLAGDELLRQLGSTLRQHIRKGDILARLGGDEFGILMQQCTLDEAYLACTNIKNIVRDFQFGWQKRSYSIGVSIGIASINKNSGNAVDILKEADSACYVAKEKGRNRVQVFKPNDAELSSRQGEMQWVEKIQQGLEHNYFVLFGQVIAPIFNKEEGLHFETLVRYKNADGSTIPPGAFLPAAERYNIASDLDKWVISNLFQYMADHPDWMKKLSKCSINLSGLSLSDEAMLTFIIDALNTYQVPAEKICFEVTETAAIDNLNHATHFITQLKEKGCAFSLDDFGSGLSSFGYLKQLPVDYLKIDGLFVKDILIDPVDKAMVKSINDVGQIMGKKTIAEFVENDEILAQLKALGVDYAQGYGIAKPVPLDKLL